MSSDNIEVKEAETETVVAQIPTKDATINADMNASPHTSELASEKTTSVDTNGNDKSETTTTEGDVVRTWDHTNRKVIIRNTSKFMKNKDLDKLTKRWLSTLKDPNSIRIVKKRKAPNQPWVQVTLEGEDMVQPFVDHINESNFTNHRGDVLRASPADAADKDDRKRKSQHEDEHGDSKRRKPLAPKTDDEVRDAITPLWRQSYDQQLLTKQQDMIRKCATKVVQEVKRKFRNIEQEARRNKNREATPLYDWIRAKQPIHVEKILPSPHHVQYRNKVEMNFGYREEGGKKIPAVGFLASGWSGGVSSPHILANIPSEACAIVDVVNEFLKDSPTIPYDAKAHRGLWRVLTIRISRRTKECMVIIMHAPPSGALGAKDETDDYSHLFESERARLIAMLTDEELSVPKRDCAVVTLEEKAGSADTAKEDSKPSNQAQLDNSPSTVEVTSIYFQEYEGVSNPTPDHPVQHAFGKRAIQEKLGKCTFQISPGAFFQVNTEGAETLYNQVVDKIREVSPNPEKTLLLDVCCGTGTIGQYCMKEGGVGRVVGVDISEPAIEDAKINAEINGFGGGDDESNRTRFVAGRAEQVLAVELKKEGDTSSVVAVLDPARHGLHADVIKTLRMNSKIQRVIYVSCNPTGSLVRDSGFLCAPPTKRYPGQPYFPSSAQPVDMFPSTPHCEMIMTFDRLDESAAPNDKD